MAPQFIQMTYNKATVTKIVLKNLPPDNNVYSLLPIDKVIFRWFISGRSGTSWQLKQEGEDCFQLAQISYYDYKLFPEGRKKSSIKPGQLIQTLQKKLNSPFSLHIGIKHNEKQNFKEPFVRIYDDKLAMLISLYGSVEEYIKSDVEL